jgi:hypothetical protein
MTGGLPGSGDLAWLWWAPLAAACLHILEEFVWPGGFAEWDRAYRPEIAGSITPRLHLVVNGLLLAACVAVGLAGQPDGILEVGGTRMRSVFPPSLAVPAWIALAALLASNALFHVAGSVTTKRLSPGVRTGVLLYIPMFLYGLGRFLRAGRVSWGAVAIAVLMGGSYHLWAAWMHRARAGAARPA